MKFNAANLDPAAELILLHWLKIEALDDETVEPMIVACNFARDTSQIKVRQWKKTVDPAALDFSFLAEDIVSKP